MLVDPAPDFLRHHGFGRFETDAPGLRPTDDLLPAVRIDAETLIREHPAVILNTLVDFPERFEQLFAAGEKIGCSGIQKRQRNHEPRSSSMGLPPQRPGLIIGQATLAH